LPDHYLRHGEADQSCDEVLSLCETGVEDPFADREEDQRRPGLARPQSVDEVRSEADGRGRWTGVGEVGETRGKSEQHIRTQRDEDPGGQRRDDMGDQSNDGQAPHTQPNLEEAEDERNL